MFYATEDLLHLARTGLGVSKIQRRFATDRIQRRIQPTRSFRIVVENVLSSGNQFGMTALGFHDQRVGSWRLGVKIVRAESVPLAKMTSRCVFLTLDLETMKISPPAHHHSHLTPQTFGRMRSAHRPSFLRCEASRSPVRKRYHWIISLDGKFSRTERFSERVVEDKLARQ